MTGIDAKKKRAGNLNLSNESRSPYNVSGSNRRSFYKAEVEKKERIQRKREEKDALRLQKERLAKKSDKDCAVRDRE